MTTEQTTETYSAYELSRTTPWREEQWTRAKSWMGWDDAKFAEMVPVLIAMGGEPYAMAAILRSIERQDEVVLTGVDGLRARRYIEARAVAAATEERLRVLTELLEIEHYRADQAESALGQLQYDEKLPRVWMPGVDEAPPEDILALIDLNGGCAYVRRRGIDDQWQKVAAGRSAPTVYTWPIPDAGPFIALPEDWELHRVGVEQSRRADEEQAIRSMLYHRPGYAYGPLPDVIGKVLEAETKRFVEQKQRADTLATDVRRLEEQLSDQAQAWDEGAEATAEWMASNPGPSGVGSDPPSNPYEDRSDES